MSTCGSLGLNFLGRLVSSIKAWMVSRLKTVLEWPVPKDVQMHITCGKSWGCVDGVGQRILYVLELPISCSLLCCWSVGWLHYSREMGLIPVSSFVST